MSNWLLDRDGLLPVHIIVTEPAVGYGGGLALVYFHDKVGSRRGSPPSVSAVAGAAVNLMLILKHYFVAIVYFLCNL